MDKSTINEVISFLKQSIIQSGVRVDAIALFGSALSGNMDKDSDIDLIIVSSDFSGLDLFERARLTMYPEMETMRKFKVPMDVLNFTPEEYENSNAKVFYKSKVVA